MNTNVLSNIMKLAWQFVKRNGFNMSLALKVSWLNYKVKTAMKKGIVKFRYQKIDGSIREAFGTTDASRYTYQPTGNGRPVPSDCVRYWDTIKGGFRMFKTYNLLSVDC